MVSLTVWKVLGENYINNVFPVICIHKDIKRELKINACFTGFPNKLYVTAYGSLNKFPLFIWMHSRESGINVKWRQNSSKGSRNGQEMYYALSHKFLWQIGLNLKTNVDRLYRMAVFIYVFALYKHVGPISF